MPSSKAHKHTKKALSAQMGLDFIKENQYIIPPSEGDQPVETELFEKLEEKINNLLSSYTALKEENQVLVEENRRFLQEREGLKGRIDAVLSKLEGV